MSEGLKPCPFCGASGARRDEPDPLHPYEPFGLVVNHREGCFFVLPYNPDPDLGAFCAAWNTREPDVIGLLREARPFINKVHLSPTVLRQLHDLLTRIDAALGGNHEAE